MTSATDTFRDMLDERGVEYRTYDSNSSDTTTWFDLPDGREVSFEEFDGETTLFKVWCATPEQAIASTLGSCNCSNNCTDGERTNGTGGWPLGADGICIRPGDLVLSDQYGECTVQSVTYTLAGVACTLNAKVKDAAFPVVTSPGKCWHKHRREESN